MVKNPPANAGDVSSIPSPGRSHVLQSNSALPPSSGWAQMQERSRKKAGHAVPSEIYFEMEDAGNVKSDKWHH